MHAQRRLRGRNFSSRARGGAAEIRCVAPDIGVHIYIGMYIYIIARRAMNLKRRETHSSASYSGALSRILSFFSLQLSLFTTCKR